jgi:general secretion pathway protein L
MRSVGIDIGTSSIKVAEVNLTPKGLVVSQIYEHALGQNPAFDPEIEILDYIRSAAVRYTPEHWQIVVGLKQEQVAVRNKIFPFNDRIKILKSLPFELEEDLPFNSDNAIYDAKIIMSLGSSAEVLACATPVGRVGELLEKFHTAGIDPHIVSVEGIALANCWEKWNDAPPMQTATALHMEGSARPERQIHLVIELGHSSTIVCAFDGNSLIGVRSILWGGKNVAEAIAQKYEISFVEALQILKNQAFILPTHENATYDQIVFSDTICEATKELTRDLQMTILEFQTEFNSTVVSANITGGLSQIQHLHTFLTRELEVGVNPSRILTGNFTTAFNPTPSMDTGCGVAVGLAIEGLKRPRNPALNFMKGQYQKQNKKITQLWEKWGDLAKTVAIFFVVLTLFAIVRDQVSSSLVDKSTEGLKKQAKLIARLSEKKSSEENIRKFINEQRKKTKEIKSIQNLSKMNSALDILKKISENSPGKNSITLTVKKIKIQNSRVEVEGTVARPQEISALQKSLASMAINGKVDTTQPTLPATSGGTPFAFSFQVDRGVEKSAASSTTVSTAEGVVK